MPIWLSVLFAIVACIGTIVSINLAIKNFSKTRDKDIKTEGTLNGTILTELGVIKEGNERIMKVLDKQAEWQICVTRELERHDTLIGLLVKKSGLDS